MSEDETDCGMLALIFIIVLEEILVKESPTNLISPISEEGTKKQSLPSIRVGKRHGID